MIIVPNLNETIGLNEFSLAWRWDNNHNPTIDLEELELIKPFNETEAKRLNKIIDFYENPENLKRDFVESDWLSANSETVEKKKKFADEISELTAEGYENVFISWNRSTCVYMPLKIFIKYWDDFCYPGSDDVTILSEYANWVLFYNHIEVCKFWKRK